MNKTIKSFAFLTQLIVLILSGCGRGNQHKNLGSVQFEEATKSINFSTSEKDHPKPIDDSNIAITDLPTDEIPTHKLFLNKFKNNDRIFFQLNKFDLSEQDKEYLDKVAKYLELNQDLHVEIQGNCDIRGSKEYNIALGEKRANAVFEFLKTKGIPKHRMTTVSFGSRILFAGDTEEIYAKNRVCIIVIQ